ncbi:MAG: OmpA family protein [Acidiferrobacterales bacterium]|nr:OmpA family protein [Acidiferrobacterales bacterium]
MNRKLSLVLVMALGLTLTACAGKKDQGTTGAGATTTAPTGTGIEDRNPYGLNLGYTVEELAQYGINGNPLNYKTLYFEYNSSSIDKRSEIIATAHARNLANTGGSNVTLEGHADERGTRDYNLALGERRGQAVAQLMNAVGAGSSSIQTISYGEERPANTAHNEAAWQENRRVQISY